MQYKTPNHLVFLIKSLSYVFIFYRINEHMWQKSRRKLADYLFENFFFLNNIFLSDFFSFLVLMFRRVKKVNGKYLKSTIEISL